MKIGTLTDLLNALGYTEDEHIAICHQSPTGPFSSTVTIPTGAAQAIVDAGHANIWYGVNPITGPPRVNAGRGRADGVTRLAAIYADLDVKPGGLADFDIARTVVDTLTEMLTVRPTAITYSGHGLQPIWAIDDPHAHLATDQHRTAARSILRRFGRLAAHVADRHHGHVDSVFDLARILRAPGTTNLKAGTGLPVTTMMTGGRPLTLDEIREALDAYGIVEQPEDTEDLSGVHTPPDEWVWATTTCPYSRAMIASWAKESPAARHPWLAGQAVRLAAAARSGCVTTEDHQKAVTILVGRFTTLLTKGQPRDPGPGEVSNALSWGTALAASMTDERALRELGNHTHRIPFDTTSPPPAGTPEGGDPNTGKAAHASRYFDPKDGLLVATLTQDILDIGPLATGVDDITWSYRDGVWTPDKNVVRDRAAGLLGERYRRSHGSNAEDVARAHSPLITCEPLSDIINFRNGLYLWQADQLRSHDPDVRSTVQLSVDWDPTASCPEFDTFLTQVLPEDMIGLAWELIGYLMYSGNPLHRAVMLTGGGRNGKGTFLRVINALLGKSNVTSVSLHDLVNTRFSTASLFGRIANIAGDIDGTYLESTATFKAITGQDLVSAEHKGRDRFDFTPWAVPVFSANKIPGSADVTVGYLSRWVVINFPHDFTGREDRTLNERLHTKTELAGVAANAMPALRRLMARGEFEMPDSAKAAMDDFTRKVDQVRTWLDECAEIDPDNPFVARTALYADYKAWVARDGYRPVKAGEFYERLEAAGGWPTVLHGTRGFTRVRVIDRAEAWPK